MGALRISIDATHTCTWDACRSGRDHREGPLWTPPKYIGFQAPVPAPPDYSTAKKVTARCWEAAGKPWTAKAAADRSFAKLMKDFRVSVPKGRKCPVKDRHNPRWEYRRVDNKYQRRALRGKEGRRWQPVELEAS
jgi:hypothetical protein